MTIAHEAIRLFLAVSALILVGMLSNPMGGDFTRQPQSIISSEKAKTAKPVNTKQEENKHNARVASVNSSSQTNQANPIKQAKPSKQAKIRNQFPIRSGGRWVLLPANNHVGTVALRK